MNGTQTAGSIIWNLDIDDSKFKTALQSSKDEIDKTASSINGQFAKMSKSFSTFFKDAEADSRVFSAGLLGVGTALGAVVFSAVNSAQNIELLRASFDTLTGSAEKGGKLFKEIFDFAAKTPFETSELSKATETMLGFGLAQEDVLPNLKILGDISLGNKERLQQLALAFSQVSATGRLTGQDLLQMVNAGFNPLQVISEKTGVSLADLKKRMEKGAISADMVKEAMVSATSEGGRFFEGMEKGAQTLAGLRSTFNDLVATTTRSLVGLSETGEIIEGGLIDKLKDGFQQLNTFLTENQGAIKKFVEDGINLIIKNGPILAGIIAGGITPAIIGLGIAIATSPLTAFIAAGAALGVILPKIVEHFGGWNEIMNQIRPVFETFVKIAQEQFFPMLVSIGEIVKNVLIPELQKLWEVLGPILTPVLKALGFLLAGFLVGAIASFIGALFAVVATLSKVVEFVRFVVTNVRDFFLWLFDVLVGHSIIPDMINEIVGWFKSLPQMITNALKGLVDAIASPFKSAFDSVKKQADEVWEKLQKINPFHRNSPSLVDNVTKGLGIIKNEYGSLSDMQIENPFKTVASTTAEKPATVQAQRTGPLVNVETMVVRDDSDISKISRELGFRIEMSPAFINNG